VEGDGYEENKSPHSSYERFEGATVGRMALVRIADIRKYFLLPFHIHYLPHFTFDIIYSRLKKENNCRWSTSV